MSLLSVAIAENSSLCRRRAENLQRQGAIPTVQPGNTSALRWVGGAVNHVATGDTQGPMAQWRECAGDKAAAHGCQAIDGNSPMCGQLPNMVANLVNGSMRCALDVRATQLSRCSHAHRKCAVSHPPCLMLDCLVHLQGIRFLPHPLRGYNSSSIYWTGISAPTGTFSTLTLGPYTRNRRKCLPPEFRRPSEKLPEVM